MFDPSSDKGEPVHSARIGQAELVRLVMAVILSTAIGGGLVGLLTRTKPAPIIIVTPAPTATREPTGTPAPIRVYVSGQVVAPAVYELPFRSIVEQAITAAGGFSPEADRAMVNLAQPLVDGAQVHVPAVGEADVRPLTGVSTPLPPQRLDPALTIDLTGNININTAAQDTLESLPGIGPALAQAIIAHRDEHGPFNSVADIVDVSGIGEAKFAQIESRITVGGN